MNLWYSSSIITTGSIAAKHLYLVMKAYHKPLDPHIGLQLQSPCMRFSRTVSVAPRLQSSADTATSGPLRRSAMGGFCWRFRGLGFSALGWCLWGLKHSWGSMSRCSRHDLPSCCSQNQLTGSIAMVKWPCNSHPILHQPANGASLCNLSSQSRTAYSGAYSLAAKFCNKDCGNVGGPNTYPYYFGGS